MATSVADRRVALLRANEIRLGRARLRASVRALPPDEGLLRLAELFRDPPEELASAIAIDVLSWARRMGGSMAEKLWARALYPPVPSSKHVMGGGGGLTERQREMLAKGCERKAVSWQRNQQQRTA
jgi:hypothetical protein